MNIYVLFFVIFFWNGIFGVSGEFNNTETEFFTENTELRTTTDSKNRCVNGRIVDGKCHCDNHYEGEQCDQIRCDAGHPVTSTYDGKQRCSCIPNYYGTYCQNKCEHGVWMYTSYDDEYGRCQCVYGWTGTACDISHSYSSSYQSYTASIIFLCLAAFLAIACVLCVANKRRRQRERVARSRDRRDQQRYGSFSEGNDNPALSTVSSFDSINHPPPPPLPKYEDALKLPVYVAPVVQCNHDRTVPDGPQPPPYAEISTISEIASNMHNTQHSDSETGARTVENVNTSTVTLPRQNQDQINGSIV